MQQTLNNKKLAIIGAGPSCVYVLERIAAYASNTKTPFSLELSIFERSGQFGAGQVHSTQQPKSSFLNRIAGQVSFAADESVENSGPLFPKHSRLPLHEWCQEQYNITKDESYNLKAEDWPKRYMHGLALKYYFDQYCDILRNCPYIKLSINHAEIVDVVEEGENFKLITNDPKLKEFDADHILFATGHSFNDPAKCKKTKELMEFSNNHTALYISSAYPLENSIPAEKINSKTVVGCDGMGLTALDIVLYLTEGRGGIFETLTDGKLKYIPSGLEPLRIIPFSQAGLFTFARPFNAKERNLAELEHKGVFLTNEAVDELRKSIGKPIDIQYFGTRYQLDFERHLLPLIILEMAYVYYRTLLGNDFAQYAKKMIMPGYTAFLSDGGKNLEISEIINNLVKPLEKCVDEVANIIDPIFLEEQNILDVINNSSHLLWNLSKTINRYIDVIYGPLVGEKVKKQIGVFGRKSSIINNYLSPFNHNLLLRDNRFYWLDQIQPIAEENCISPEKYQEALLKFMHKDHRWASQNNLDNPAKAAADGVWRDLRPVLSHAADFGGLNAESHQIFLNTYMRHHNRLCNGAALEVMEKMVALIEYGILDISVGPDAQIHMDETTGKFRIYGSKTQANYQIDCLIDAKIHAFDPERDISPLYPNLLKHGLVQKWKNPSKDGEPFEPGGLTLTPDFHPIRANGTIDNRLTFLGPPTEGVMFFQLGALRPNKNHHVMQDILLWFRDFWEGIINDVPGSMKNEPVSSPNYTVV